MLSEILKQQTLATINDDCKELIFGHLDWSAMLNIAESNKQLYTAVRAAFKRKYGNAKIDFGEFFVAKR